MSFAYMPLYTGDYLRDTRHLTPLRHGVYVLALMHCWDSKGPMPLDEQECAGVCNCRSADEIEALRYVLIKFFVKMEDGFYNKRIHEEIEKAEVISHARSEAGKRGYQARAKHLPNKSSASESNPTPIPYHPHAIPKKPKTTRARTQIPENFGDPFSPEMTAWLEKRGETQVRAHLIFFVGYARANGKLYADWDQAFKNCVRDDWAKVRKVTA